MFVDLPTTQDRAEIFGVHLRKRLCDPAEFDLSLLAERSNAFSGAEIESAVKGALLMAFEDGQRTVRTEDILTQVSVASARWRR